MDRDARSAPLWLGIDVGGTNVKAGVVTDDGRPLSRTRIATEAARGPKVGLDNIERVARAALADADVAIEEIDAVGLATPGTMDIGAGLLLDPPNLPGWTDLPIRKLVEDRLLRPTVLQNDANAAAYGEFWVGGAKGAHSLVLWTLGTGVGCGIIVDHLVIEGAHSHGSECGHIIVAMDGGRRCDTGQYGTLEAYVGAKGLLRRCDEALAAGRESTLSARRATAGDLTPLDIAKAAEAGDALAVELVLETARILGVGTVTVMHVIDPEIVLIAGGMTFGRDESPLGRRFLARVRQEVQARAFPIPARRTRIEYAALGGDAGIIGAAGCARLAHGDAANL